MISDLLFNKIDIFSVTEHQKDALKDKVRAAPKTWLSEDDNVVERLAKEFEIVVPELHEDRMEVSQSEVDVDVSRDPFRFIPDPSRPFYIKGTQITFHIPFSGDAGLFNVQPSSFTLNPPRGQVVGSELQLVFQVTDDRAQGVKATADGELAKVRSYLNNLKPSAVQLNSELRSLAQSEWQARKKAFLDRENLLSSFNLPQRKQPSTTTPEVAKEPSLKAPLSGWDVFISHASEDKGQVGRPLVRALEERGLRVWFDENTLKLGDSLRKRIDEGLAKSRYGVVILSQSFFAKHWPQQELNGLAAREVQGKKVILPVWHEVDHEYVAGFSPMLADRLAVKTSSGIEMVADQILDAIQQ